METIKSVAVALPDGKFFERLYHTALVPWAAERGAGLVRIDLANATLGSLCTAIERVDLVIADVSGENARVTYVAGYAHGIGKRVLFITQVEEHFPFGAGNQTVIVYSGNLDFLRAELESALSEARSAAATEGEDARARFQAMFGEILRAHGHEHRGPVEMENAKTFVLLEQDMDLALVQDLSRHARELGVRLKLM
jgi:hypothetical protein